MFGFNIFGVPPTKRQHGLPKAPHLRAQRGFILLLTIFAALWPFPSQACPHLRQAWLLYSTATDACNCCSFERFDCGSSGVALAVSNRSGYSMLWIIPGEPDQRGIRTPLDIIRRLAVTGIGQDLFQSPNTRTMMGAAPRNAKGETRPGCWQPGAS